MNDDDDGERLNLLPGSTPWPAAAASDDDDDAASRRRIRRGRRYYYDGGLLPSERVEVGQEQHRDQQHVGFLCPAPSRASMLARVVFVAFSLLVAATTVIFANMPPERADLGRVKPVLPENTNKPSPNDDLSTEEDALLGEAASSSAAISSSSKNNSSSSSDQSSSLPNVIFILIDDVGMNDIGYESTDLGELTPFIDSLSAKGVRLGRYYTNHLCTPSRSSLMTGRDTFRTGMQFDVIENSAPWGLALDEATLAERFKAAGYATHMVGKWHLGMFSVAHYPFNRGFDTFLGYMGGAEGYKNHVTCETPTFPEAEHTCTNDFGYGDEGGYIDHAINTTRWGPRLKGAYSTSLMTERAIEVAAEHEANDTQDPLFLYVAYQAAHVPVDPPPTEWFTEEEEQTLDRVVSKDPWRRKFAAVMFYLDKSIRQLVEGLDGLGILDNTLLVFASDNGGCPDGGGSNYPFRGFKHTLFEGGVRVPAFVYSKSEALIPTQARGTRYEGMMHSTDWTPTLASVVPGLPLKEMGQPLSGFDQWQAIIGQRSDAEDEQGPVRTELVLGRCSYTLDTETPALIPLPGPRGAYIYDGWKIVMGDRCASWFSFNPEDKIPDLLGCDGEEMCTSCTSDCVNRAGHSNDFLFHIETDPYEMVDLKVSQSEKFEEMIRRWRTASKDEAFPLYQQDDPAALEQWSRYNDWVVAWL